MEFQDRLLKCIDCGSEFLFTAGEQAAEFQRTVSRLYEMQSVEYLRTERRKAA